MISVHDVSKRYVEERRLIGEDHAYASSVLREIVEAGLSPLLTRAYKLISDSWHTSRSVADALDIRINHVDNILNTLKEHGLVERVYYEDGRTYKWRRTAAHPQLGEK